MRQGRLWHGAAWYPELWPGAVDEDLRLMREAGINLVRIAEFAWAFLEPEEGRYELGWLGAVMDKCRSAGISVVLCTPTAAPPRWLTLAHPETLRVDVDGRPFSHGARQHISYVSCAYRAFSRRITEEMARTLGRHPALAAWQTDNEFLCHVDGGDFGPEAERAWQAWLERRYGSVAELNRRWRAGIWSETYPSFASVPMPVKTPWIHHACLMADWSRFTSHTAVAFQAEQLEVIRRHSSAPITHNQVVFDRLFADDLTAGLDFASTDFYLPHDRLWEILRTLDLLRRAKDVPYVILETSPYQNGSVETGHAPHPEGFLPAEALLALGMGGSGFCYWPWRQPAGGVETCHGAVLSAWGTPSAGWKGVCGVSEMMAKAEPILTAIPSAPAEVALHDSHNARAHFRGEPLWKGFHPFHTPAEVHRGLREAGLWRDVRFEGADISHYKVVVSAFLPILTADLFQRMARFVEAGGTWIVGPASGIRTEWGAVHTDAGLGALDNLAGVRTRFAFGTEACAGDLLGEPFRLAGYCLAFEPAGAAVLGRYADGPGAGLAWASERRVGKGRLVLVTAPPGGQYARLFELLLRETPLRRLKASWGTELIPREGNGGRAWFVVNWDGKGGAVELPEGGRDLLGGREIPAGRLEVPRFGTFAVLSSSS